MSAKENFIINYDTNEIKRNDIKKVDISNGYRITLNEPNKTVDISKDVNIEIADYSDDAKIIIAYYEGNVNNG